MIAPLLLLLSTLSVAEEDSADIPSVKEYQDRFWLGPSLSLSGTGFSTSAKTQISSSAQLAYGFTPGILLSAALPYVLFLNNNSSGASAPYLGGGLSGRIELEALARLWKDELSYFGMGLTLGLPVQTDPTLQNSILSGWYLAADLFGRYDLGVVAFEAKLIDGNTFNTAINLSGRSFNLNESNLVEFSFQTYFYPSAKWTPYLSYTQVFPTSVDVSSDGLDKKFLLAKSSLSTSQGAGAGIKFVPVGARLLFTLEGSYLFTTLGTPFDTSAVTASTGVRWLF